MIVLFDHSSEIPPPPHGQADEGQQVNAGGQGLQGSPQGQDTLKFHGQGQAEQGVKHGEGEVKKPLV